MVFQSYALYPHMNVRQNMEFSLKIAKLPQARRSREAGVARRRGPRARSPIWTGKPASSRAGSASAWRWAGPSCREPEVFLFDEPLSNLDAKLRNQMRAEIKRLHAQAPGDH